MLQLRVGLPIKGDTLEDEDSFSEEDAMTIDEETIQKISSLARLSLTEEEQRSFGEQLTKVLEAFEKLLTVDTEGVEPLVVPTEMVHELRDDQVQAYDRVQQILDGSPERVGNLFKVPPVV